MDRIAVHFGHTRRNKLTPVTLPTYARRKSNWKSHYRETTTCCPSRAVCSHALLGAPFVFLERSLPGCAIATGRSNTIIHNNLARRSCAHLSGTRFLVEHGAGGNSPPQHAPPPRYLERRIWESNLKNPAGVRESIRHLARPLRDAWATMLNNQAHRLLNHAKRCRRVKSSQSMMDKNSSPSPPRSAGRRRRKCWPSGLRGRPNCSKPTRTGAALPDSKGEAITRLDPRSRLPAKAFRPSITHHPVHEPGTRRMATHRRRSHAEEENLRQTVSSLVELEMRKRIRLSAARETARAIGSAGRGRRTSNASTLLLLDQPGGIEFVFVGQGNTVSILL